MTTWHSMHRIQCECKLLTFTQNSWIFMTWHLFYSIFSWDCLANRRVAPCLLTTLPMCEPQGLRQHTFRKFVPSICLLRIQKALHLWELIDAHSHGSFKALLPIWQFLTNGINALHASIQHIFPWQSLPITKHLMTPEMFFIWKLFGLVWESRNRTDLRICSWSL